MRRVTVHPVLAADLADTEVALVAAFADDPLLRWLFGVDDAGWEAHAAAAFFRPTIEGARRRGHAYLVHDPALGVVGAALWAGPEIPLFGDDVVAGLIPAVSPMPAAPRSAGSPGWARRSPAHHPDDPHFYLGVLGVTPRARGSRSAAGR